MLNGLDLFSGIGGLTLALGEWVRPVAYCEIEPYAAGVLFSRMLDGSLPTAPIFPDIRKLHAGILPSIDIMYGGFPCQDISNAGARKGLEGERSGLFFEICRLVGEVRPQFIFLENVAAITVRGLERVISEITALGYDCRWTILSAAAVGAPHLRERWWLLAHANEDRQRERDKVQQVGEQGSGEPSNPERNGEIQSVADAARPRRKRMQRGGVDSEGRSSRAVRCGREEKRSSDWWETEPAVGRVAYGVPLRLHRIAALGNSVVPQCAREAFIRLCGIEKQN